MATAIDSTADLAAAEQTVQRARKAKATIDKHQSILFRIKLQDAKGNHVPVYQVANKMIGFFCSKRITDSSCLGLHCMWSKENLIAITLVFVR